MSEQNQEQPPIVVLGTYSVEQVERMRVVARDFGGMAIEAFDPEDPADVEQYLNLRSEHNAAGKSGDNLDVLAPKPGVAENSARATVEGARSRDHLLVAIRNSRPHTMSDFRRLVRGQELPKRYGDDK